MKDFSIPINAGTCECSAAAKQGNVKPSLKKRVIAFFRSYPTITKEWLHYKM
ncbi:hypothetical protein [Salinimicrobium flavum]|uniref:Uncharacterized protein n=1 Tax=Salinimicrobium flavum TaxID=1737065 RepID=A0ABW5IUG0_9FLAO